MLTPGLAAAVAVEQPADLFNIGISRRREKADEAVVGHALVEEVPGRSKVRVASKVHLLVRRQVGEAEVGVVAREHDAEAPEREEEHGHRQHRVVEVDNLQVDDGGGLPQRAAHEEHERVAEEPAVVVAADAVANVRAVVVEEADALAAG
eukprot:CAMPEP_0182585194 /NCGR_PEP_ID=MMETSP1324-20130603/59734_1 /TAXON_ID=236786 /ORGANISM="Florenciella sp., Strain RCC1587" /LENGTH=149 /DNA_ID=CAMNT_0024801969 /DNA_START=107 /DNA_END=551 /DNA_ORIENTATION=+